jgi:C-terminal region of Mon2 protein
MHFSSFLINPRHFKNRMAAHYKSNQDPSQNRANNQGLSVLSSSGITGGSTGGGFTGLGQANLKKSAGEEGFLGTSGQSDIMFSEQLEFSILDPALISI